jgi:hypothetical protein
LLKKINAVIGPLWEKLHLMGPKIYKPLSTLTPHELKKCSQNNALGGEKIKMAKCLNLCKKVVPGLSLSTHSLEQLCSQLHHNPAHSRLKVQPFCARECCDDNLWY